MKIAFLMLTLMLLLSCNRKKQHLGSQTTSNSPTTDSLVLNTDTFKSTDDSVAAMSVEQEINVGNVYADSVVAFAESLIGTPYKYASTDPAQGFDCSGFITYVFSKFNITVPRSSKDFEHVGETVLMMTAKRGDLVLFTGTDTTDRTIGHMGIVTTNENGKVRFIHSTSGKANGVTISDLGDAYMKRYVKTVRVFNQ
jgi:cell wall-associated NlpC family hydrolase